MHRRRLLRYVLLLVLAGSVLPIPLVWSSAAVQACSLNGVPSLSVNGNLAAINQGTATQATVTSWAPFTLPAAAPNTALSFQEDLTGVRQSLSPTSLATPFLWSFGDGTGAQGYRVTHQYRLLGQYRLTVSYRWQGTGRWIVFDSASLVIVAPSDLWRANLRYNLAQDSQMALRILLWVLPAVFLIWFAWRRRLAIVRRTRDVHLR